jgi:D-serine deaminase-like pyridoxal phosphate-dependent protein
MQIQTLPTPALLIDLDVLERNLKRMQSLADHAGVRLRPHVKTHKSLDIAQKQRALGARGITVSTIAEAEVFARGGFDDITWALPNPLSHLDAVLSLSHEITLRILIDDLHAACVIDEAAQRSATKLHAWLKVDCGYHRAGVDPRSAAVLELIEALSTTRGLVFDGILTHAGHAYAASNRNEIRVVAEQERAVMLDLARRARERGLSVPEISIGSTPSLSVAEDLSGVDEIRPGNYVFYDYTQASIGSCTIADCALTVLASVISAREGSDYFVTDAGALALSKDAGPDHLSGHVGMGRIFSDYETKSLDHRLRIERLSQEHGIVRSLEGGALRKVGDKVRLLEHHSCLTAAQFDFYHVVRGDEVIDRWHIERQR